MVFGFDFIADALALEVVNVLDSAAIVFKFHAAVICRNFDAVIKPLKMGSFGHRVQVVELVLDRLLLSRTSKAQGS